VTSAGSFIAITVEPIPMDDLSFSHLTAEIKRLDQDLGVKSLYDEACEGDASIFTAIESAQEACDRARKIARQVLLAESSFTAAMGFTVEVEALGQLIEGLARCFLLTDREKKEIAQAMSEAEAAIAEAHGIVEQFAMPDDNSGDDNGNYRRHHYGYGRDD
jgi:hypothetical protein